MRMYDSAKFQGGKDNHLFKNPFSRRRRRKKRKMEEGGEKRTGRPASSDDDHTNEDGENEGELSFVGRRH